MPLVPKPNFTAWFVMQGYLAALNHPDYKDESAKALITLYKPLEKMIHILSLSK
jgi:hypothetical protein